MKRFILIGAFAVLAGCQSYTDKTSPCFGRGGAFAVSRNSTPALLFGAAVSRNAVNHDCLFLPIGSGE